MSARAAPPRVHARRAAFPVLVAILSLLFGILFIGVTVLTVGMWLNDPVEICAEAAGRRDGPGRAGSSP
jgi:hypothetical protein